MGQQKTPDKVSRKVSAATKKASSSAPKKQTEPKTAGKTLKPVTVSVEKKISIAFVASEASPFIKTGGLADVIGSLPVALSESGNFEVSVFLPLYGAMESGFKDHLTYVTNFNVPVGWRNQYCGLFYYKRKNVTFYFIDNEYYFKRENLYGYYDDGERFAFFSRAAIECLIHLDYYPDVIHCHDWQSALTVVYLKTVYRDNHNFDGTRTIFTVHNIEYQGRYSHADLTELFGIDGIYMPAMDYKYSVNLMKGAFVFADSVTTVSKTYANEILSAEYACGLEYAVNDAKHKLCGITNGIDIKTFDPSTDKYLFKNYSVDDMSGKAVCKAELQKMLGLPVKKNTPIVAMISRLVSHKGLDLVRQVLDRLLQKDVQVVILGKGDSEYEGYFTYMSQKYPEKMRAIIAYNKEMSSKIYAGADLFLMPSRSEPCGLSQMIAARYGAVPIVRRTGGLNDTITPYNFERISGNGFMFNAYNAEEMLYVMDDALETYKNKKVFGAIVKQAMTTDFSWNKSAREYEKLYFELSGRAFPENK